MWQIGDTSRFSLQEFLKKNYIGYLFFYMNMRIVSYILQKIVLELFIRIVVNLQIAFAKMAIFTVLLILIHQNGR